MTFARQKRLLLGLLALLAPIPLPFNEVVSWPVVGAYLVGVLVFLRWVMMDRQRWLPTWALNTLGLIYLPLAFLDVFVISRRLLTPVLHLIMFALLVKLFSLTRERDKWQVAIGVFFLFLASMGTSVHPTIVLYLIAFLGISLVMLTRFAFLPRVSSPYIVGRGSGLGQTIESSGFSDEVTLDSIGQIRNSRDVALRLLEEGAIDTGRDMRFKAATYDLYQGGTWRRSPRRSLLRRSEKARFWLVDERQERQPKRWARIFLAPINSRSVPLPAETLVIEPRATRLELDEGGAVSFRSNPLELVEYRVGLVDEPVMTAMEPSGTPSDAALDLAGVTPPVAALAARVMGGGTPLERTQRLEAHLIQDYEYTQDFRGRSAENPIEDFLFRYKSGQCEYFASSMVLLLRSQGIPARLVTGFLGGEYNPFEGYYIVRDSNAHAWVEAYVEGEGWRIFDPTPPAGRPIGEGTGVSLLMRQAWDFVAFRWDRYVLTFGVNDQLSIFSGLRGMWRDLLSRFQQPEAEREKTPAGGQQPVGGEEAAAGESGPRMPDIPLSVAIGLTLFAAGVFALYLRFKPPLTATAAYARLRRRLSRRGEPLPESVPPLRVGQEMAARYPAAAEPAARIIAFYLRESFGGQALEDGEREALESALDEAEKGMRKAG